MERVEHRIKLNLMKTGLQGQVNVKKADTDSRKVCIYLSYAAKPFDLNDVVSAVLRAEKPDGKVMFNNCTVCEDRLEYIITTQTIASIGTVTCEITLTSGSGQVLVTPRFEIIVSETIYSDSEIESTDEYTALTETLKKAASLKDGITPTIGENGNWYLGETDTGKPSRGEKGDTGASGEPGKDGTNGSPGADGLTPTIGENGNWYFDNVDTGKPSRGLQGEKGTAFQYSDFTSEQLAALKGEPGAKGEPGVGIATCNLFYQYGNSNVTPPTGSWTTVIPSSATGEYLWTRIQFTYTRGKSPTFITLVTKQGKDGSDASVTAANIETALGYIPQRAVTEYSYSTAQMSVTLADNAEYRMTGLQTLTVQFPENEKFECWMRLNFAASGDITVTLPAGTGYIGTAPDFKNGETWELSFKDKILAAQKVGEGT